MAESPLSSLFSLWNKVQEKSSFVETPSPQFVVPELTELNDMVYRVYQPPPEETPELEVVFFHGLQFDHCRKPYATTWMTRDNSECWLQTWLVESFPKARIFTVSYNSSATKTAEFGRMDMYQTGENLVADLTADEVGLGQAGCPVVLVGHCLGGLVLKEVCLLAETACRRKTGKPRAQRAEAFFSNLKGMFFYGTPHTGSVLGDMLHDCFKGVGALSEEIESLRASSTRRNESFMELKSEKKWSTYGIGELRETYVQYIGKYIHVGSEASTRSYMDGYYSAPGNHYEICKPEGINDSSFQHLCGFLRKIQEDGLVQRGATVDVNAQLQYYVDREGRAEDVQRMLAQPETANIFIVGLSGSGKTALAQHVFHKICHEYEVACFVSLDSIEATASPGPYILRKIREEMGQADRGSRINRSDMVHRFYNTKVLMVLDNVDSQDQLDALCISAWLQKNSSKIIVTTTNPSSIATTIPWLRSPQNTFKVPFLSADESKDLFCHYAFGDGDGPEDLKEYIQQAILKCGNYPLFLKILGACISKREFHDIQLWVDLVTRLDEAEEINAGHDEKLWAKLRLCYEGLQASERQIFLDIATIFHGFPLSLAKCIWKASRRTSHLALQNLEEQFFVYEDNGHVWMHQHLINLGKRIACPDGVGIDKWQRISDSPTASRLITNHEGIVEALALLLHPLENEFVTLRRSTFQNFIRLEYLILENVSTQGMKLELPRSLVYLRWRNGLFVVCPVYFTHLENLAALEFICCKSMRSLPPDVIQARKLSWLELEGCELLTGLPFGLSNCLEYLGLNGTGLNRLPRDVGKFQRLAYLQLDRTQLQQIPRGVCRLAMLRKLELRGTKVTTLPESFTDLKSLEVLNLGGTKLCSLPEDIGQLQNLVSLHLDNTPLEKLPDSICRLHSLRRLFLLNTQLTTVPSNIGDLVGLRDLYVSSAKWRGFPRSFGMLSSLQWLILPAVPLEASEFFVESEEVGDRVYESDVDPGVWRRQSGLHLLPSQSPAFQAVTFLTLHGSGHGRGYSQAYLPTLFSALQHLPLLASLHLEEFDLPEIIPPELGNLTSLQTLRINRWERLRELPECLGKLCKLWILELTGLPRLSRLPEALGALPLSLTHLDAYECGNLQFMSHSVRPGSSVGEGCSTSEGHTGRTLLESLKVAFPSRLHLSYVSSDLWSTLESFLECGGKHYAIRVDYLVKCEEWEKARKVATNRGAGAGAEHAQYVLDRKLATELFPEMSFRARGRDMGLPGACVSSGSHLFNEGISAQDQRLYLFCKQYVDSTSDYIEVVDLHRECYGNDEDCEETWTESEDNATSFARILQKLMRFISCGTR